MFVQLNINSQIQKSVANLISKRCQFFKEKYGEEEALTIIYESDDEITLQNQSDQSSKRKRSSKLKLSYCKYA